MYWDAATNTLLANDVGLHSWEEINIITKGANYGYAEREGNEQLFVNGGGRTGSQLSTPVPFPEKDLLTVEGLPEPVTPVYPVAVYSHQEGDSIGSGFVYRSKLMPQLTGKYFFSDITTGRLFYADLAEMIASQRMRNKQATIHDSRSCIGARTTRPTIRRRPGACMTSWPTPTRTRMASPTPIQSKGCCLDNPP